MLDIPAEVCIVELKQPRKAADMTTTIKAKELRLGDYIIGDRLYVAGTLDMNVTGVTITDGLVTVKSLSGLYATKRTISYGADDAVILGGRYPEASA